MRGRAGRRAWATLAALGLLAGCGGSNSTVHLHGKVTLGGQPIPADAKASITFAPPGGSELKAVSVPIVNGEYDSPATPVGKLRAYFEVSKETGPVKKSERTGAEYRDVVNLVPPRSATGVEIEVAGENLDQNFDL
ncbi:MAG: hypothetical protein KF847_07735 [Pirellulales bacterium]|nr:hypothetical protein [Pirellulales bacterium]